MFAVQVLAELPFYRNDCLWMSNMLHLMQGCCTPAAAKLDSRDAIRSFLTVWTDSGKLGSLVKFAVKFHFFFVVLISRGCETLEVG